MRTISFRRALLAGCFFIVAPTAGAAVTLEVDAQALSAVLPAVTLDELLVPIAEGRSIKVGLHDLRVTGFEPTGGKERRGAILTSLRLRVPQLGLDLPVEPRLTLRVVADAGPSSLEMRFDQALLRLPLGGVIDVATFLPPLRFPAENVWAISGLKGDALVRSRLTGIRMGPERLSFDFELELAPSDTP